MRNMNTRKIYYPLYAVLCFLCLFFVSCEKPGTDTPRDESLVLKVSSDSVSCVPHMGEQTALQIQWTAGTNHGTGSAISYTIVISHEQTTMDLVNISHIWRMKYGMSSTYMLRLRFS